MVLVEQYVRGSEWRKWDLHIHTPASFLWRGGKSLKKMDDTEKLVSIKKFIETINKTDVAVFGIQDYWTFDWYIELRKYLLKNPNALEKTVLPGMELRIECPVDYRLNIHVLISNQVTDQQLLDFKSGLQIRNGSGLKNLSDEALVEFARSLDASKANKHGFKDPNTLNEDELLELGSKTAEITKDSFTNAFEHIPNNFGFVLLPYDTSDGILGLDWEKHPQDDNYFMQIADIFESRDQKNIDLFNGKETKDNQSFFKNFFKTIGSQPKPCISGSDAHKFAKYGVYPSNKATWIKADPTFEGLRQIIYEPSERVRIQELEPEEKSKSSVIDYVEYVDKSNVTNKVYFNKNLNSIIGSRAQGKSNLLKNIAFSIDPEQCNLREVDENNFLAFGSFKVFWADGKHNTLNRNENKEKGILFIPQKYLGELIYEDNTRFEDFLINLFENQKSFQDELTDYRKFEGGNFLQITSLIRELITITDTGRTKAEQLKKLGNKDSCDIDIRRFEFNMKKIGKTVSINTAEMTNYKNLILRKTEEEKKLDLITQDISSFKKLKEEGVVSSERAFELPFSQRSIDKIRIKLLESDENFKKDFIDQEIEFLDKSRSESNKSVLEINRKITPLQDKIEKSQSLLDLTKALEKKKSEKQKIEELERELVGLRKQYDEKKKNIITIYLDFENKFNQLEINLGTLKFSKVKIVVAFDVDSLIKSTDENINYHNSVVFKKDDASKYTNSNTFLNDHSGWIYEKRKLASLFTELLEGVLSNKLLLKSGRDSEEVLLDIFKNRYKIDFLNSITSNSGVVFAEMSDGEQILALLEFIFKFDDYDYPVLLDQPEDDLDSRAISTTIVDFIKKEKFRRQIIVVSHNANLVVCADSEEVLVSKKIGRRNPVFEYKSGAIENDAIKEEIIDVLEGGVNALKKRMGKLRIGASV